MFDVGQLHFDEESHVYSYADRRDVRLLSVTQCLKEANVVDYSYIPQATLEAAAKRGTLVHKILHYEMTGGVDSSTIDERLLPYVTAARAFLADSGFKHRQVECRVFDAHYRYAGQFDVIGTIGSSDAIVDWKTGALVEGHKVQLAAYAHATEEPYRYRRILVQLKSNGKYRVVEAAVSDHRRHFGIFASAAIIANWANDNKADAATAAGDLK